MSQGHKNTENETLGLGLCDPSVPLGEMAGFVDVVVETWSRYVALVGSFLCKTEWPQIHKAPWAS